MHASTGVGALGAMAAFLQHSPRERSYDDLTDAEVEEIGRTLDALREEVLADRGARDAAYIRRVIAVQRCLEVAGRVVLLGSRSRTAWWLGTASLTLSKVLDNMEIGHNVLHGQWDWMRDPRIHSSTWDWDYASRAEQWKRAHNDRHHMNTNVARQGQRPRLRHHAGRRGAGVAAAPPAAAVAEPAQRVHLRVRHRDVRPRPRRVAPLRRRLLVGAEGGDAHDGAPGRTQRATRLRPAPAAVGAHRVGPHHPDRQPRRQPGPQRVEPLGDHVRPLPRGRRDVRGGRARRERDRGRWYVRQMLGSADVSGPPLLHVLCGNLSHQIEHHLFPDLPSNRYREIAGPVRELFERTGWPTTPRRCGGRSPAPGRRSSGCRCRPGADPIPVCA